MLVFLVTGAFSMSAAIAASKLLKRSEEDRPTWARSVAGARNVLLVGNLFAIILVAAMWYGITHLTWWIPVLCLFITFPVLHVLILERLLGDVKGMVFSGAIALGSAVVLALAW